MALLEIKLRIPDALVETIIAELSGRDFDNFWENGDEVWAYVEQGQFSRDFLVNLLQKHGLAEDRVLSIGSLEEKNWNEIWESNFDPVSIGDKLIIRASFHQKPENIPYDIIISPKMSFGTGHHETTHLCLEEVLKWNLQGADFLDMGCGTGVIGILAKKMGAKMVLGIDIDRNAVENSTENTALNKINGISIRLGDSKALKAENQTFDFTVANITKNALLADIPVYLNYLRQNGLLLISGFLESDIPEMISYLNDLGLSPVNQKIRNQWACLSFNRT